MSGRRLVLSLAVTLDDDVADRANLDNLDIAPGLRRSLLDVLTSAPFGYEEVLVASDGSLHAQDLGQCVLNTIAGCQADDVLIVHVIGHGYAKEGNTAMVYVVGSDGKHNALTNVTAWLDQVGTGVVQTLFLLDFCYSGNLPGLDAILRDPALSPRAWLICASQATWPTTAA